MDLKGIKSTLLEIQRADGDDAKQHELEDKLLWDFVTYISEKEHYTIELKVMANEILKSKNIEFSRWYD